MFTKEYTNAIDLKGKANNALLAISELVSMLEDKLLNIEKISMSIAESNDEKRVLEDSNEKLKKENLELQTKIKGKLDELEKREEAISKKEEETNDNCQAKIDEANKKIMELKNQEIALDRERNEFEEKRKSFEARNAKIFELIK